MINYIAFFFVVSLVSLTVVLWPGSFRYSERHLPFADKVKILLTGRHFKSS